MLFLADVSKYISAVRNSRLRPGFTEVLLPGEPEDRLRLIAQREGTEIEDLIYYELQRLSQ